MKILFVTKGYPSEIDPMSGNYEAVQAHAIAALGHTVTVVCFKWRSLIHLFDRCSLNYRRSGNVDVYEMEGIIPTFPIISKYVKNYRLEKWMMQMTAKKFAKKYRELCPLPDVIHIHSQFIAKYTMVLKNCLGVPAVLTEHWSGLNEGAISSNIQSEAYIYKEADAVISVSHALQKALRKFYGIESHVVYNMVDDVFFQNLKTKQNAHFNFVSVGRMVPVKCFENLILAMSFMDHTKDVFLTLVGDGPERLKLEKLIKEKQLQNRIILTGLKKPEEVSQILCQSDCFVLSSHRETFGIVLIEAMAKGLPVISTRCGGPEDIVNNENGILVEADNPQEMAKAMDYMIDHYTLYDSNKIINYCKNNFSQAKVAQQIINIYENVV